MIFEKAGMKEFTMYGTKKAVCINLNKVSYAVCGRMANGDEFTMIKMDNSDRIDVNETYAEVVDAMYEYYGEGWK